MNDGKKIFTPHFSQIFKLKIPEDELDFFDVNLKYDLPLFIDPFLIKKSPIEDERKLFERFGDFFRFTYDEALKVTSTGAGRGHLKALLNFHEAEEIGLGFTEKSHKGSGPGPGFASLLYNFFLGNAARRLIKEEGLYPDGKFNPVILEIFIDRMGPDGLSDMTADIIKDYLILYTQEQCKKLGVERKRLGVNSDGFDFQEMEWKGGNYYELPENPFNGNPILLVPKRFLRASETHDDKIETKVKGILKEDPELARRFSLFINKRVEDISIDEVRTVFLQDQNILKKYIEVLTKTRSDYYDFDTDLQKFYAIKTYSEYFKETKTDQRISSCEDLLAITMSFIHVVDRHFSSMDGWKELWTYKENQPIKPKHEAVMGRIFRGMGYSCFANYNDVTFIPEAGTGNGPVDFLVVYKNCRIAIELKKLLNDSRKGRPPMQSYLHGIIRQLPEYAHNSNAKYAIYITEQNWSIRNRPENNHDDRVKEIQALVTEVEQQMKDANKEFVSLTYINIDVSPHPSTSGK